MRSGELDEAHWPLGIEMDRNRLRGHRREVGGQVPGSPAQIKHDSIAPPDPLPPQHPRQPLHTRQQLAKRHPLVLEHEKLAIAPLAGMLREVVENRVRHRTAFYRGATYRS